MGELCLVRVVLLVVCVAVRFLTEFFSTGRDIPRTLHVPAPSSSTSAPFTSQYLLFQLTLPSATTSPLVS